MVRRPRAVPEEQEWIFRDYVPPEIEEKEVVVERPPRVFGNRRPSDRTFRVSVHPLSNSDYRRLSTIKRGDDELKKYLSFLQRRVLRNKDDATIIIEEGGYLFGYCERTDGQWRFVSQRYPEEHVIVE